MGGWTDREGLREQYGTDANLSARQSIYAFQEPKRNLAGWVFDLVGVSGDETVLDVGCGNGLYEQELARRQHRGTVVGLDLSIGMLRKVAARRVSGDAARLPIADGAADLSLAPHMLYHVPDPRTAVRELRRVTRPGGKVAVVLNGDEHLAELQPYGKRAERVGLDDGQELLEAEFGRVTRHELAGELRVPDPGPIADYLGSRPWSGEQRPLPPGPYRIRTHTGCLIAVRPS